MHRKKVTSWEGQLIFLIWTIFFFFAYIWKCGTFGLFYLWVLKFSVIMLLKELVGHFSRWICKWILKHKCAECYVMLQEQTGFKRSIKGFKKREGEKCVNSNREQVMFFFHLEFFTRFSGNVFVQSNHYFRGNVHVFFFFPPDGQFF